MRLLRRFWARSSVEKRALLGAVPLLAVLRVGLRLLPFRTVARVVLRVSPRKSRAPLDPSVRDAVGWAVVRANRAVPGRGACLPEALAAHVLLSRAGFDPQLQLGGRRGENGEFVAHAWIEEEGHIVVGGTRSEVEQFAVFKDWTKVRDWRRKAR